MTLPASRVHIVAVLAFVSMPLLLPRAVTWVTTTTCSPASKISPGAARKSSQALSDACHARAIASRPWTVVPSGQSVITNSISGSNASPAEKSPRIQPS